MNLTTEIQNHLGILAIKAVAAYGPGMLEFTAKKGYTDRQLAVYASASAETGSQAEVWHFTAHETAKLLIAARDIVIVKGVPYWEKDVMDAEDAMPYSYRLRARRRPDWDEFVSETSSPAGEFNVGEEMDVLVAALIAAGAREIEA